MIFRIQACICLFLLAAARAEPVLYSKDIAPVFKRSCVACHNETKAKAKLNLETVELMMKGSGDGPVLIPGKAEESLLYIVSAYMDDPVMPPENNKANAPRLNEQELALLKRWIDEEAKDDGGSDARQPVDLAVMPDQVDAIYSVALSPSNLYAAAGRGNRIQIYHLPSGRNLGELTDPTLGESGGAAHLDIVGAITFGGDGLLASGGFRNVKLWRRSENPIEAEFAPLAAEPSALAISQDGKWALAADASGAASLFQVDKPAEAPKGFKDHGAAITGAAFAPDGRLITASLDRTVKIRAAGGEGEVQLRVEFASPIHSMALVDSATRVACGCEDGVIRIVPIDGEATVVEYKAHEGKVSALAGFGEGAKSLLSGGADAGLKIWSVGKTDAPLRQAKAGSPIAAIAVSNDGRRVAAIGENKILKLWNGADLKHLADLKTDGNARRKQSDTEAKLKVATAIRDARKATRGVAEKKQNEERDKAKKAADAEVAAVTELAVKVGALDLAEAAKRQAAEVLVARTASQAKNLGAVQAAAKKAEEDVAKVQKEADDARRKRDEAARNAELAVRFSGRAAEGFAAADAALAAAEAQVTAATAVVELAKKATGEVVTALTRVAFEGDDALVVASADDGFIYSWGAEAGAAGERYRAGKPLVAMAKLPAGGVFGLGADKSVSIYTTQARWVLERTIGAPDDIETFVDRVNTVAFSADARFLATGGGVPSRDGVLKVWRVRDGAAICANADAHSDSISAVAFSPDGKHIATAATDRFVKVFSAEDASLERSFEGHTNHVLDVAWRADGLALASSGADNVVKVWDYEAGTQKQTVTGHSKPVTSVAFVGAGETLLSSSGDKSVRLANQPLPDAGTFMHAAETSGDGAMVAAGGEDSVLRIWRTSDKKMLFKLR